MASTVSNGNDRSEKWQRPFQMATTVYEREISVVTSEKLFGFGEKTHRWETVYRFFTS